MFPDVSENPFIFVKRQKKGQTNLNGIQSTWTW